jgi:pantothenate synthetase
MTPDRQRASADSLLRRLQAATERIQRPEQEYEDLRDTLARTLGASRTAKILETATRRDTPGRRTPKLIGPC